MQKGNLVLPPWPGGPVKLMAQNQEPSEAAGLPFVFSNFVGESSCTGLLVPQMKGRYSLLHQGLFFLLMISPLTCRIRFLPFPMMRVWLWAWYFAVSPLEAKPKEMPSLPKSPHSPQEWQSKIPQGILEIFLQRSAARLLLVGSFCSKTIHPLPLQKAASQLQIPFPSTPLHSADGWSEECLLSASGTRGPIGYVMCVTPSYKFSQGGGLATCISLRFILKASISLFIDVSVYMCVCVFVCLCQSTFHHYENVIQIF